MTDLVKSARLFASSGHERFTEINPASQSAQIHLKAVAHIVSSISQDEELIAAAWLHDIVEETSVTIGEVKQKFGPGVARLLGELTVDHRSARLDHDATLELKKKHFADASASAQTVKLADLIDTCSNLYKTGSAHLKTFAAEANQLAQVLEGGDARLLARLKRDLNKYAADSLSQDPVSTAKRFVPISIPVAGLRMFEYAFTAQDISEPLISFDLERGRDSILEAMRAAGLEVAGLHRSGALCGFLTASEQMNEGEAELNWHNFLPNQIVDALADFAEVIEVLTRHDRCFVSTYGTVDAVISRVDLHKPAARMWLFGIVTVTEMEFTEQVRLKWPDDSWLRLLTPQRVEMARHLYAERERRKERCQLVDCLQLSDKIAILASDPSNLAVMDIPTPSAAKRISGQLESLRNSLAHSQGFVEKDWPQIVRLARRIRHLLNES